MACLTQLFMDFIATFPVYFMVPRLRLSLLCKSVTRSLLRVPTDDHVRTRDPQNGCQRKLLRTLWHCRFQIHTSLLPVISNSTVAGAQTSEAEHVSPAIELL